MQPDRCVRLHELRREVMAARRRGRVIVEFDDGLAVTSVGEARMAADQMITLVNLPAMGPHWVVIDRQRAAGILTIVLHWDLATFGQHVADDEDHELTEQFLAACGDGATYLTNVRASADLTQSPHRWASGAETNELDAGVVAVSPSVLGMLWVQDRPVSRRA